MIKTEFLEIYNKGIERNRQFMAVKIETEGNPGPEVIINSAENFDKKIAYYLKAYDDNMELIKAKEVGKRIAIVDIMLTNNLDDINWFIY